MPIKLTNTIRCETNLSELNSEEDAVNLLREIRRKTGLLDHRLSDMDLKEILGVIERDRYEIPRAEYGIDDVVDFSEARALYQEYRRLSEGGCDSCNHLNYSKPMPDETYSWCGKRETEKDVRPEDGISPRIRKYSKEGCEEIARHFRKLEDVLKGKD